MNDNITTHAETTVTALRDLIYHVHSDWVTGGMKNDRHHSFHMDLIKIEADLASSITGSGLNFGGGIFVKPFAEFGTRKKIQAIKSVRELTGLGLKESKEYVDDIDKSQGSVLY